MLKFLSDLFDGLSDLLEQILDFLGIQKKGSSSSKQTPSNNVPVAPVFPTEVKPQLETELKLGADVQPQYRKSKSILTYREGIFYNSLIRAVDNNRHQVFAKVRLADFLWLANEPENRKFHQNQILCKHIDFLLCDKFSLAPILGIELDDSSHKLPEHQERDKFKDDLFSSIGLPLLRMDLQSKYSSYYLRRQIEAKLKEVPSSEIESPNSIGGS
jgi:hypothetical protein